MKHVIRIIVMGLAVVIAAASNLHSAAAMGEAAKHVLIAEVSPEAKDSASKEFVVLYNPNAAATDVTGWLLQYRSASRKSDDTGGWATKAILGCKSIKKTACADPTAITIAAGETLRLSNYETGEGIEPLASGMATTGGEVRLVQPGVDGQADVVQDMVGYGHAADYEGKAAPAPKAGQSIARFQDEAGVFVDTGHNDLDFVLTPGEDSDPLAPPATGPSGETRAPGRGAGESPAAYRSADITEVMPDPASPNQDSTDEFIELYNPSAEELDLTGYVLKTGTGWTHKYTIADVIIGPYGYVALTSAQTHLSLSNSGSGVRLYDSAGNVVSEAPSYGKAQTGNSWIKSADGQWVWTTKPTPGEQNIAETPPPTQAAAKKTAITGTTTKQPTTKAASSTKKPASTKPKSSSSNPAVKGLAAAASQPASAPMNGGNGNQIGMWVLAGAGALGMGYALYEYRQEIGGFMRRGWQAVAGLGRR